MIPLLRPLWAPSLLAVASLAFTVACLAPTPDPAHGVVPVEKQVPARPTAPRAGSSASAVASTAASVASAQPSPAVASAEPPRPPPPRATPFPGADLDKLAFVESLCPAAVETKGEKVRVGCRACPPFEGDDAKPDGRIVQDPTPFFELTEVYGGSFTRSGATQAVLAFEQCRGPGATGAGTVVVEKSDSSWHWNAIGIYHDVTSCVVIPRASHDVLACHDGATGPHDGVVQLYTHAFAAGGVISQDFILDMSFNSPGVCNTSADDLRDMDRVRDITIRRIEAFDADHDGKTDLRVHLRYASIEITDLLARRIIGLCKKPAYSLVHYEVIKPQLVFLQRGDKLLPSTAAQTWLKEVAAGHR